MDEDGNRTDVPPEELDGGPSFAHFALQKLNILPGVFAELQDREKAFVIASITLQVEKEKRDADRAKRKRRR